MIEIANDLQMSSAKQNFDHWLISIKEQDCFFSRTAKKKSKHSKQMKGFLIIRDGNKFSGRSNCHY